MKQRLITAAYGIPMLIIVLVFYNTVVLNIAMAAVSLIAIYEVLIPTKYVRSKVLFSMCAVFTVAVPFFHYSHFRLMSSVLCYLFIIALFVFLLARHKTVKLELIGTVFLLTLLMSFSLSCIVFIRDNFQQYTATNRGLFYIILVFAGAWITDAGAYFIGRFFGKRKLAPEVSPKKTVEGAAGGFVSTIVVFILAGFIYSKICSASGLFVQVDYTSLAVYAALSAVAAILGDLSASLIKRECHLKDFGNIIPGHGGVLDRFDSLLYVAPLIFILSRILPVV